MYLTTRKPETFSQPTSSGSYTTEDIQSTHVSKATFKPSSGQAPPYATLPRGGPGWMEVDENFNETYASEGELAVVICIFDRSLLVLIVTLHYIKH